jgi:hypothetical protein
MAVKFLNAPGSAGKADKKATFSRSSDSHSPQKVVAVHLVGEVFRIVPHEARLRQAITQGNAIGLGVNHHPTGSDRVVPGIISFHHLENVVTASSTTKRGYGVSAIRGLLGSPGPKVRVHLEKANPPP